MDEQLNDTDFVVIVEALGYSKMHIENYQHFPSYEFKLSQLERVESALLKIKALSKPLNTSRKQP